MQKILAPMLVAGVPALIAGLVEDITKKVGVRTRLLATMFSGILAWYFTGIAMRNTGVPALDWVLAFTPVAVLFTAFAVSGVTNAINIVDGFNGLAAGAVSIMLCAMGFIALDVGDGDLAAVCFVLAGVTLGFAALNWPWGKIFLGDGGAYLLGFLLGWIAVLLPMRNPQISGWTTLLGFLVSAALYWLLYLRLTQFSWCITPLTGKTEAEAKGLAKNINNTADGVYR